MLSWKAMKTIVHSSVQNRKLQRKILSIAGATIILGTFVSKDARKDELKERLDSIDNAESAFLIQSLDQANSAQLKYFRDEFTDFRTEQNRTLKNVRESSRDGNLAHLKSIDWPALDGLKYDRSHCSKRLMILNRFATAFPVSATNRHALEEASDDNEQLYYEVLRIYQKAQDSDAGPAHHITDDDIIYINLTTKDLSSKVDQMITTLNSLSNEIFDNANKERERDEGQYKFWTGIYYTLFAIGWLISIAGISIEGKEDETVIEELAKG